jgi:hypothetical protein
MGISLTNCYRKPEPGEELPEENILQNIKSAEQNEKKLILKSNPRK